VKSTHAQAGSAKAIAVSELRVQLLGSVRVAVADKTVRPLSRGGLMLLAYLLVHRDVLVTRAKIARELYGDARDSGARSRLRRHVMELCRWMRDCGVPDALEHPRDALRLRRRIGCVDLWEWEDACARGDREKALQLYRGELLAGFDDAWIVPLRAKFAELHRAGANALRYFERIVRADPYDESAVRGLMQLRSTRGDRVGALLAFRELAERLKNDLGSQPESETIALERRIAEPHASLAQMPASPMLRVAETLNRFRCVTLVTSESGNVAPDEVTFALAPSFPHGVVNATNRLEIPERLAGQIGARRVCVVLDLRNQTAERAGIAVETILRACANACVVAIYAEPLRVDGECAIEAQLCLTD